MLLSTDSALGAGSWLVRVYLVSIVQFSYLLVSSEAGYRTDVRYAESTFPRVSDVDGLRVTCGEIKTGEKFAAPTWSCADARVNDSRLAYGYVRPPDGPITRACGKKSSFAVRETDLKALCQELLKQQGVKMAVWAVFMRDMYCKKNKVSRILIKRDQSTGTLFGKMLAQGESGHGYIKTLQCMIQL